MNALRETILRSGETQAEWARRLDVSRGYLHGIINGTKRPSLDLALRIERLTDGAVPVQSWADVPEGDDREDAA